MPRGTLHRCHPRPGADPLAVAERYRKTQGALRDSDTGPDLLVFVSFSMPEASLKRLATDAAKANAVLVFRGPKEGSLKQDPGRPSNPWPSSVPAPSSIRKPSPGTGSIQCRCTSWARAAAVVMMPPIPAGNASGSAGDASLEYILERMARADHPWPRRPSARLDPVAGNAMNRW
jgi:hypothetical protein